MGLLCYRVSHARHRALFSPSTSAFLFELHLFWHRSVLAMTTPSYMAAWNASSGVNDLSFCHQTTQDLMRTNR